MGIFRTSIRKISSHTARGRLARPAVSIPDENGNQPDVTEEKLASLLEHGESEGCINLSAFSELTQALEIEGDELDALYDQLAERGITLTDDCGVGAR